MNITLENLLDDFNNLTDKPENFISTETDRSNEIKLFLKLFYDFTKNEEEETSRKSYALPELIIEDFDLEQIWQQIELQNEDLLQKSLIKTSKFAVSKNPLLFSELDKVLPLSLDKEDGEQNDSESEVSSHLSIEHMLSDSNEVESDDNNEKEVDIEVKPRHQSVVDDDFFKLDEMEQFLKKEEKALNTNKLEYDSGTESKEEEEEIDYFQGDSGLEDNADEMILREKNPKYKDFFQPSEQDIATKRNKFLKEQEELEDEINKKDLKSTFELREDRLKNKVRMIEEVALSGKPWQLQGEITAEKRPLNSLLEEIVEFDLTSRPAPIVTEKTTFQLEDIIRQRIKDKVFDSVERKQKPVETPLEYKKKLVLDQEKSKQSLAHIYEKEYLQQVDAVTGTSEENEDPKLHNEIKKMMQTLFKQLDGLSNYHFTPKPAAPELRIINNLPAINMEEVAPLAVTDASLLAPEEVKERIKGDIIGKSERTDTDKKRERRKKKRKQQIHVKEKQRRDVEMVNKMKPGLGNKYSKERVNKQLESVIKDKNVDKMDESMGSNSIKSSSAFFKQLEEVKSQIENKTQRKRKQNTNGLSAKKIKL